MNQQPTYQDFYVTFPQWMTAKKNGYIKIIAENLDEAALVVADKCGLNFSRLYVPGEWNDDWAYLKGIYPDGQTETYAVINHNGKRFVLNNAPLDGREVVFVGDNYTDKRHSKDDIVRLGHSKNDIFWYYELTGAHDGEKLEIAVCNVKKDYDTYGACIDHDGLYFADDLTPLDDLIPDWYDGVLMSAFQADYFSD